MARSTKFLTTNTVKNKTALLAALAVFAVVSVAGARQIVGAGGEGGALD